MKYRAITVLILMGLLVAAERTLDLPIPQSGGFFAQTMSALGKKYGRDYSNAQKLTIANSN